jgi:hypothetical protein
LNKEIVPALLDLQVRLQHAENDRNFVAAAITPKGSVSRDNKPGVTEGQPKAEKRQSFFEE